ncbi:MAG: non-canonical purine NTP pyrophosphatase, partial [Candidatus Fimimonas sp.]
MKLIIASNNKHKVEEISTILQGKFEEIVPLAQTGIVCDSEENGATF